VRYREGWVEGGVEFFDEGVVFAWDFVGGSIFDVSIDDDAGGCGPPQ